MHSYKPPYLQPYKGKATRHTCPQCGVKESFTLYLDGNTNEQIHRTVGKCNREFKCGYHYTPKQYFLDNPDAKNDTVQTMNQTNNIQRSSTSELERVEVGFIPFSFVERSASYQSNFVRFLCNILSNEQISTIGDKYALGATKNEEIIFWQIDINGKVRTGKIMQYNPETGKRIKHENGAIDWVHNKLKQTKQLPNNFNLQQCFFGEHLLKIYPDALVCIVESEKSALISASLSPNEIWLATGGINNLSSSKCHVLKGRNVILYPDLGAYDKWLEKAAIIQKECNCLVKISQLLENISTTYAKANGLDIADFMIYQLRSQSIKTKYCEAQKNLSSGLQKMINKNETLMVLIDKLELVEI